MIGKSEETSPGIKQKEQWITMHVLSELPTFTEMLELYILLKPNPALDELDISITRLVSLHQLPVPKRKHLSPALPMHVGSAKQQSQISFPGG
jgi:hypothetical protein